MKHYMVVAAIIIDNDKVLCTQRSESKFHYISLKYEFPGGKVENEETNEDALIREIKEELELSIKIIEPFLVVDHSYPDFKLTMCSYLCSANSSIPMMKEHVNYQWLKKHELMKLDWAAADLPIVKKLMEN